MSVWQVLQRAFGNAATTANGSMYPYRAAIAARLDPVELPSRDLYRVLRAFYLSNSVYDELARSTTIIGRSTPQIKAIRNTTGVVVDFFSLKMLPDPLVIVTEREAVVEPIEQVHRWSNWGQNRRLFGRYVALFGECYLKVIANAERGRVYFEVVSPEVVTDFECDERGYLVAIRLDVPQIDETVRATRRAFTFTEHWSKADNLYRSWETDGDAAGRALDDLGQPSETFAITDLGVNFPPFTRAVFRDLGEPRGIGAVQLALEAIVEADLSATNLHSMLYQDADGAWVLKAVGTDANGRPLPPPVVGPASANGTPGRQSDDTVMVGKRSFWRLPGNQELQSVVADIDYTAALAILRDHDQHLERLMPSLAYSRISEMSGGDLSGRAIRFKLTPAVDQVSEVRANAVAALIQADQIALTLAAANGIPGFEGLGSFEAGDFQHEFEDTQVIVSGDFEDSQTEQLRAQAFAAWTAAGLPLSEALLRAGYTEEAATEIVEAAASDAEEAFNRQQELMAAQPAPAEDGVVPNG